RFLLLGVAVRADRRLCPAVAVARMALSIPLAHRCLRGHGRQLRAHPAGAGPAVVGGSATRLWARRRADLLLLPVLFHARWGEEERARRFSRGGDWRGQLRRPGDRGRRDAFLSGRARPQRVGGEWNADPRTGGINLAARQAIGRLF